MPFTVIYDANVLYPFHLRDILIRVAQAGLVHARWTDKILDEWFDNLTEQRPELTERLKRTHPSAQVIRDIEADLQSRPGIPYVLYALANAGLARSVEAIKAHL